MLLRQDVAHSVQQDHFIDLNVFKFIDNIITGSFFKGTTVHINDFNVLAM